MKYNDDNYLLDVNNGLELYIPHCPVVLVLDASHSMWGQGLIDLKNSITEFFKAIGAAAFTDAQIDIETIKLCENYGIIEAFTPIADSTIASNSIRPKGDTPIGAALQLAISEMDKQLEIYRSRNISSVTPQLIILTDGRSSDDFSAAASEIKKRVASNSLICRVVALGNNPDYGSLAEIAGDLVFKPQKGKLPEAFREIGRVVSQEYEKSAVEILVSDVADHKSDSYNGKFFVIDGTNMLYWNHSGPSLIPVLSFTKYLKSKGHKFVVFFDASTRHKLRKISTEESLLYEKLLENEQGLYLQMPAGVQADDAILRKADSIPDSLVVTQDLYRDYSKDYDWIKSRDKHAIGYILDDYIYFRTIKLKVPLVKLENCLG